MNTKKFYLKFIRNDIPYDDFVSVLQALIFKRTYNDKMDVLVRLNRLKEKLPVSPVTDVFRVYLEDYIKSLDKFFYKNSKKNLKRKGKWGNNYENITPAEKNQKKIEESASICP